MTRKTGSRPACNRLCGQQHIRASKAKSWNYTSYWTPVWIAPARWPDAWARARLTYGRGMSGAGATLERWQALAAVGEFDLSLCKLYEGHTDALSIINEIDLTDTQASFGAWCVWAAEVKAERAIIHAGDAGGVRLSGAKYWCSGAQTADHALLTAWQGESALPQLVAVELNQPGVLISSDQWNAVGMAGSRSVNVAFDGARGRRVGKPGDYLNRPGFWQGGAGIAACWFGGTVGIASVLRKSLLSAQFSDASGYKMASMGKVELAIQETANILKQAAQWIDANPLLDSSRVALSARLSTERSAKLVIDEVGKAMGATPFCLDHKFALAVADLPVFIRQSHAERDFAALGERSLKAETAAWCL